MAHKTTLLGVVTLLSAQVAFAADTGSVNVDQLQIPGANSAITPGQVTAPQARSAVTGVNEVQGRIDLCDRILAGQAPPVRGLDCSANALQALQGPSALTPSAPATNSLDSTIDSIGRGGGAIAPDGGVPPIVILQH